MHCSITCRQGLYIGMDFCRLVVCWELAPYSIGWVAEAESTISRHRAVFAKATWVSVEHIPICQNICHSKLRIRLVERDLCNDLES